ncbi:MAG: UvrD-helicase domain-containing protein [Porphyromonas sp.]|nr:UvrD-helicase domain-containing protein [Porphyromonas sp.]
MQTENNSKRLTIYTASAGSGKTFRLTLEYIKLILKESYPKAFKQILAVTFTTKATGEMKDRILRELHTLTHTPDSSSLMDSLTEELKLAPEVIQSRAKSALEAILDGYGDFRVQTIDSFFQEIVRSFVIEIDVMNNYEVEIDTEVVQKKAMENLFGSLDDEENNVVLGWIGSMLKESLQEDQIVSIPTKLSQLAPLLFSEEYAEIFADKEDSFSPEKIKETKKILTAFAKENIERYTAPLTYVSEILESAGIRREELIAPLKNELVRVVDRLGEMGMKYWREEFEGMNPKSRSTFMNLVDSEKRNLAASKIAKQRKEEINALYDDINPQLKKSVELFGETERNVLTSITLLSNLDILPILVKLYAYIEKYRRENNCLIISDISQLLNRIISGAKVPFVYEKVGSRIHHYMIDEFQDTSGMQWLNFKPLLEESLASGYENMLVGDVKQSIYRFRGSESSLLATGVPNDSDLKESLKSERLNTNWRSLPNIVRFNNNFFSNAVDLSIFGKEEDGLFANCSDAISQKVYTQEEVEQNIAPKWEEEGSPERGLGYVTHLFLPPKEKNKNKDKGQEILEEPPTSPIEAENKEAEILENCLIDLFDRGYKPGEISILVRKNHEATKVALLLGALKEKYKERPNYRFDFFSNEALMTDASPIVLLLVSYIKHLAFPNSDSYKQEFFLHLDRLHLLPTHCRTKKEELYKEMMNAATYGRSLFETITMAVEILKPIAEDQEIYLNAFLDILLQYTKEQTSTYRLFYEWWEEQGFKTKIPMPESIADSTIKVGTIHSAKGLEYPVVILPFVSWDMAGKNDKIFVPSKCLPAEFSSLPLYVVSLSKKCKNTHFQELYNKRMLELYEDELNLLYVAYTRAEKELHVFSKELVLKDDKGNEKPYPFSISSVVFSTIQKLKEKEMIQSESCPFLDMEDKKNSGTLFFSYGNPKTLFVDDNKQEEDNNAVKLNGLFATPRFGDLNVKTPDYAIYLEQETERAKGIRMHLVLSALKDLSELDGLLNMAQEKGELTSDEAEHLRQLIDKRVADPVSSDWFSEKAEVLNERAILLPLTTQRPDRVILDPQGRITIVDYKFGEQIIKKHLKQVSHYCSLYQSLGFKEVTGYVWYVLLDKVVRATE